MNPSTNELFSPNELLFLVFGFTLLAIILHWLFVLALDQENPFQGASANKRLSSLLLGGAWVGLSTFFMYRYGSEFAPALITLSLVLCFSLVHPVFAFCTFVVLILLRPWEILPSELTLALPRLTVFLCLLSLLFEWYRKRRLSIFWTNSTLLLFAFGIWVFISTFQAADPAVARAMFFDSIFKVSVIFILCQNIIRQPWAYRTFVGSIGIAGIGLSATALLYSFVFAGEEAVETGRLATIGMLSNANDIAAIAILALPFAIAPVLRGSRNLFYWLSSSFAILVTISTVWYTRSRGALLALIVAFGALFFFRSKRKGLIAIVTVLVIATFPLLVNLMGRDKSDLNQSSFSRLNYWKTGALMAIANPLFGVGFEQYPKKYESYAPSLAFEWGERTAHSSWVLVLAETGLVGFALFVALAYSAFRKALIYKDQYPEIFLSFVGYFAAISFLSHSYLAFPYLLMATAAIPDSFTQETSSSTKSTT